METEVVIKAKEHLHNWRKEFLENKEEVKKFKVNDQKELYRELQSFPDSESDYILRLAEANLTRIVASFNENGEMDGVLYNFKDHYLIIYFENNTFKWITKNEIDECYEFFIDLKQEAEN